MAAQPLNFTLQLLDFARLPEWHSALIQSLRPSNAAKPGIEKGDKLDAVLGHVRVHPTVTVRQHSLLNGTWLVHPFAHAQSNQL